MVIINKKKTSKTTVTTKITTTFFRMHITPSKSMKEYDQESQQSPTAQ